MPLVRFEVRNEVGLGDPELYGGGGGGAGGGGGGAAGAAAGKKAAGEEDPKALLEGVAVAGLVGILRQLGDLAEFAADVFHDLHEQVIATSARGRKVLNRVQNIEAALPSLEKAVKNQKSHIHFAYVPGSDWHTQLQNEQNHLLSSDLPRFMMDSYEECRDPPRLYLLDKFDNAGAGACLKRYSDPSYFKKAWDMMRADKTGNLQREKKSKKFKRKGSRLREPHYGHATSRHRSGELQRSLTAVQLTNRQFGSSSTDGQSVSEHRSTPDVRSNADNISRSSSFSSKTRLSSVEQALEMKPSAVPHENGHDKPSKINLHEPSDSTLPILLNGASVNDMGDNLKQVCLPHEMAVASPSVKWDEKAAIIMSTSSVYCDDVLMDKVEDAKLSDISSGQKEIEHREIDTLGQQEALLQKTKLPVLSSGFNHPDEVSGEADSYMDALNTLESETETENEFQTKNQVMSVPSFNAQAPQVGAIDNPDSPIAEFPGTCQDSDVSCTSERAAGIPDMSNADPPEISRPSFSEYTVVPPNEGSCVGTNTCDSNADRACGNPSEVSELASPVNTAIPPNQGSPVCIEIPESNAKDGPGDFSEISAPGLSAYPVSPSNKESSIVNQIPYDNTEDTSGDFVDEVTDNVVSQPIISNVLTDESFEKASAAKSSHSDATDDLGVVSEGKPQECLGMNQEEATEVCNSQSDTTVDSHVVCESKPQECPEKSHEEATEASNSQSGSLNEPLESSCVIQDVPTNTCTTSTGIPSVKLWTNAGLFGLEPSKPPVFGAHDGPREDTAPAYKEPQHSHSTEYTESHCSKPVESAVVNMPNGSSSITSSFVGKFVGMGPGSANATSSGASQSAARTPDSVHSQSDVPSNDSSSFEHNEQKNITGKHTSISDLLASEESAENGAGPYSGTDIAGRDNVHMVSASSFSSIAQRFLANTLQRRTSPKYTDLSMSGRTNNDSIANDESTPNPVIEPREAVLEESQIEKKTENGINGLSKSSTFSGCRYSEKSSPPLEYMKISFHPMSASEMSKLNLDFCDGNLHENSDDMMLPTFQLLSDTSIPHPGSGSESEDDTFGRSYSYSSYDDLSPRIYSNSEVWDQEDGVGLEEHELYDGSNQIGSATVPVSSYMGFEQMSLSGMKSTMSLADVGDQNGLGTLESHTVEELPNFETLMSTNDNRNGETTIPHNPVDLPLSEDQLPPPPPLPPMQWRMMRQTTSLDEERGTAAKDTLMNASSQTHVHTSAQEEHLPQIAPLDSQGHAKEVDVRKTIAVKEISDLPNIIQMRSSLLQQIRDKSDQLKMNGQEESKAAGNDIKSLDEREELLQQIRSKTFNLRRTNGSKTDTSQPTANSNVVAILEKANAIRQAVASDEGGDDDSWSDI